MKLSQSEELKMLEDEIIATASDIILLHREYADLEAKATAVLEENGYDIRTFT